MNSYYQLKTTTSGKSMFNLKAGNHEVILTSQSYETKKSALEGIASVQKNGGKDASFEKKTSSAGEPYFVLKATNGQVIGKSEMYSSEASRDKGIASVMANSPTDKIKEV